MSKKRRRSEVSEASSEEFTTPAKKHREAGEWTIPSGLNTQTEVCDKFLDFLRKYKDSSDSCLSEHLLRAPNRRQQPHYYEVISSPIDLLRIQQKLKTGSYRKVQDFLNDVMLLFDNTKTFYSPSRDEFKAACGLESAFLSHVQEFGFSYEPVPSSLTLRIPKIQLPSLQLPPTRSQRTSSSSDSSVSAPKSASTSKQASTKGSAKTPTKSTRSRAWIDEYLGSDDPLKIYIAQVYSYHDSSGDYVAEAFHSLPSRKEYPEYYRIITEPIDLNTIKKKFDSGVYSGLKALQNDIILMIKNAHYFNEPGSVLHKKASALRKYVINKGAELWRKYQLGQQNTTPQLKVSLQRADSTPGSDPEGDIRKVPKLSIKKSEEGSMKVQRRLSQPLSEADDSQSDTATEEEVSSDEEDKQQQLMLQIKKETLAEKTPSDPLSKLLKAKRRPILHKILLAVYRRLMTKTDRGRLVCDLFRKRPSVKMYPEYYIVIKQPIDLREIREKIKSDDYSSVESMVADVELLVNNACTFNEEDSVVYIDALCIRQTVEDAAQQIQQKWPELFPSSLRNTSMASIKYPGLKVEVEVPSDVLELYSVVKECTDSRGRLLWKMFEKLPSNATAGEPSTKKILDMSVINSKFSQGHYSTVDSLLDDLVLLFDVAYSSYPADSGPSKDCLVLQNRAMKKYQELQAAKREANPVPNVKDCVQEIIKEIVTKTFSYKDTFGHCPAESLNTLETTDEFQHPDLPDTSVQRTLTLPRIQEWANQGKYHRLDQVQQDVLYVLRSGWAVFGSPTYQDAVAMESQWILMRDETCKRGNLLSSPALAHTLSSLDAELKFQKQRYKSLTPHPASESEDGSEGEEMGVAGEGYKDEEEDGMVVDKTDVDYVTEYESEGVKYQIGDIVYVAARAGSEKDPHIVLIEGLWRDQTGSMWLDGCWFYRPVETFHPVTRRFYEKEVFKSDFRSIAKLSRVRGKCGVLQVKEYPKYLVKGIPEEDTYICESCYSSKTKSFRKIKARSLLGRQPPLLPRDTPMVLRKVPSVFAQSADTEAMEVDGSGAVDDDVAGVGGANCEAGGAGVSEGASDDEEEKLKLSFTASHKNITVTVPNPEAGCTYYEQYCIDNDHFRLGYFVYLMSDQDLAYIARIDKMWTDANDDPWIRGPWFIRPKDVSHAPTRLFFENEVFQSNIEDSNSMRSVCGHCSVVTKAEYCKKRSTQYHEGDVFIAEYKYNEAEKKILKLKGIKHHHLSEAVVPDEVYHFPIEVSPLKVPSPKLFSKEYSLPSPPPKSKETDSRGSTPSSSVSSVQAAQLLKRQPNIINLNPQLVQQLLASSKQMVMTPKGPLPVSNIPASVTPTTTATQQSTTKQTQSPTTKAVPCQCQWEGCGKEYSNVLELGSHILTIGVHIVKEEGDNYYCKWKGCHRNPSSGPTSGKPFDSLTKITRHLREVHLLKISNSILGLSPLTGAVMASLTSSVTPSTTSISLTAHTSSTRSTPSILTIQPTAQIQTIGQLVQSISKPGSKEAGSSKVPSIFHPPPENKRQISHSAIYMNYIRGLQFNSPSLSSCKPSSEVRFTSKPPAPIKPSDWLGPDILATTRDTKSIVDALWALRDSLLKDSAKLDRYNKSA